MYNGKRASGLVRYQSASRCNDGNLSSTYFHEPYLTFPLLVFNLGIPPVAASMIKNNVLISPKMKMADAKTERVGNLGYGRRSDVSVDGPREGDDATNCLISGAIMMDPTTCMA